MNLKTQLRRQDVPYVFRHVNAEAQLVGVFKSDDLVYDLRCAVLHHACLKTEGDAERGGC